MLPELFLCNTQEDKFEFSSGLSTCKTSIDKMVKDDVPAVFSSNKPGGNVIGGHFFCL